MPGSDGKTGTAGAIRQVFIGPVSVEEEVVESQSPNHHAYSIKTTIPLRDHRADVWFVESANGTNILWTTSFTSRFVGFGRPVAVGLRFGVHRLARALVRAAES
jgi:hypothetical protein